MGTFLAVIVIIFALGIALTLVLGFLYGTFEAAVWVRDFLKPQSKPEQEGPRPIDPDLFGPWLLMIGLSIGAMGGLYWWLQTHNPVDMFINNIHPGWVFGGMVISWILGTGATRSALAGVGVAIVVGLIMGTIGGLIG